MEVMGLMLGSFVDDYTVSCPELFSGDEADGELVDILRRCLCDASEWNDGNCGECGSCVPNQDAGHVEADRKVGDLFSTMVTCGADRIGIRPEMVVGWYHSHPGFGCWLSSVDVNTQQVRISFCLPLPSPIS